MIAAQSSIARNEEYEKFFDPIACCKAENVLDGVFQMVREAKEIQYVAEYNSEAKVLLIDTGGTETINRVSFIAEKHFIFWKKQ